MTNIEPIIKEALLNAPVSKVWTALTDKNEMKKWYFDLAEFIPEIGFEFRFSGGKDENNQYLHICEITEVIANKKIAYSWRYDGYPGISYVTFELISEGNKTRLRLTHEGIESFGDENPDLAKENFVEGWEAIIKKNLKKFIEK